VSVLQQPNNRMKLTKPAIANRQLGLCTLFGRRLRGKSSAKRKCALSSVLFRRVEVPLALK
jgi:hypothetical protein